MVLWGLLLEGVHWDKLEQTLSGQETVRRFQGLLGIPLWLPAPRGTLGGLRDTSIFSCLITFMWSNLTVTIIGVSIGATTWSVDIASGFPASSIAITVTTTSNNCYFPFIASQLQIYILLLKQALNIPVSPWHWTIIVTGSGIGVFSVGIIPGWRCIVPWIPGIIVPTGIAVQDNQHHYFKYPKQIFIKTLFSWAYSLPFEPFVVINAAKKIRHPHKFSSSIQMIYLSLNMHYISNVLPVLWAVMLISWWWIIITPGHHWISARRGWTIGISVPGHGR